jgi:hypothetical protein
MDQRYVLIKELTGPRIFWVRLNETARLFNEDPSRKMEIFETLVAAKDAALAVIDRHMQDANRDIMDFSGRSERQKVELHQELRREISEMDENTIKHL